MCQEQSDGKNCLIVSNEESKKVLKEPNIAKDFEVRNAATKLLQPFFML